MLLNGIICSIINIQIIEQTFCFFSAKGMGYSMKIVYVDFPINIKGIQKGGVLFLNRKVMNDEGCISHKGIDRESDRAVTGCTIESVKGICEEE